MQIPSLSKLKRMYSAGDHKNLARWIPHFQKSKDPFARFLLDSNLLTIGKWVDGTRPSLTLGADPEFIVCDKAALKRGKVEIKLFSSSWTNDYFGISEAEVGADYGLLEFRPAPAENVKELAENIVKLHSAFKDRFGDSGLAILEKEAVEFDHRKRRILEALEAGKDISFGGRGKNLDVWTGDAEIVTDYESETTFSAYDKPVFQQYNDKILSAGGHIHIGGSFVKMLSFEQLRNLIRQLDQHVLPICVGVETEAAKLRRGVYGNPGEFRIKDYGIEYRSPSNAIFWGSNTKALKKALKTAATLAKKMAMNRGENDGIKG